MKADLFYESQNVKAIPLFLISESQQKEDIERLSAAEKNCLTARQFKGKLGEHCVIHNTDGTIGKAYVGAGSGNQELALAHAARLLPIGTYQLQEQLNREAGIAWGLAQYRFITYKDYEVQPRLLVVDKKELKEILALTQSIYLVRDLINTPTNDMGPKELADVVETLAQKYQAQLKQWVGDELLTYNFPAIHAVGRASASAPRLLSLTWGNEQHPRITLVGKGVCFDSGGLDIKPASGMRLMKKDMGGAAHVIGLAQWIMESQLPIRLQVLIPAVENAIGPNAFRPGDILTMRNRLTVEIENTDAEGRLILADALTKACEEKPELIIDFATLTGAARAAVGPDIAAMFCNDDHLASLLIELSQKIGDPVWRLPLFSAYDELLNSTSADLSNCGVSPYAGAILAGLFLQRFITQPISWVHFDVMAWNSNDRPAKPEGGEALGLRVIAEYLLKSYT